LPVQNGDDIQLYDSSSLKTGTQITDMQWIDTFQFTPDNRYLICSGKLKENLPNELHPYEATSVYEITSGQMKYRQKLNPGRASLFEHVGKKLFIHGGGFWIYESPDSIKPYHDTAVTD